MFRTLKMDSLNIAFLGILTRFTIGILPHYLYVGLININPIGEVIIKLSSSANLSLIESALILILIALYQINEVLRYDFFILLPSYFNWVLVLF